MRLVAQEAAGRAEYILESAPALLNLISAASANDPCANPLTPLVESLPELATLGVVDANGAVLCTTQEGAQGATTASTRPWFQELRSSQTDFVQSTAYYGTITKQWIIASARRRSNPDGSFAGAYVFGVPVNSLIRQLARAGLPKDTEIALLDTTGQVFASKHWAMIEDPLMTKMRAGDGGFMELRSAGGQDRELVTVPLAGNEFYALLSAPKPPPSVSSSAPP